MMKILSENAAASEGFGCEHGLSLYVETEKHRLLFDTGASRLFAENAVKLWTFWRGIFYKPARGITPATAQGRKFISG